MDTPESNAPKANNPFGFFERSNSSSSPQLSEKVEAMRDKIVARHASWESKLDGMNPHNPVRIVGEHVYKFLQERDHAKLGRAFELSIKHEPERQPAAKVASRENEAPTMHRLPEGPSGHDAYERMAARKQQREQDWDLDR